MELDRNRRDYITTASVTEVVLGNLHQQDSLQ
jgi:hypothetical protein